MERNELLDKGVEKYQKEINSIIKEFLSKSFSSKEYGDTALLIKSLIKIGHKIYSI